MPIKTVQVQGLNYRLFFAPFELDDLLRQNIEDSKNPEEGRGFYQPMIEDFSKVDLSSLTSLDILNYVRKLKAARSIPDTLSNNLVSCVTLNIGSFAKLRLYEIYAHLYGVRCEENFNIENNILDATRWILKASDRDADHALSISKSIGHAAVQKSSNAT